MRQLSHIKQKRKKQKRYAIQICTKSNKYYGAKKKEKEKLTNDT